MELSRHLHCAAKNACHNASPLAAEPMLAQFHGHVPAGFSLPTETTDPSSTQAGPQRPPPLTPDCEQGTYPLTSLRDKITITVSPASQELLGNRGAARFPLGVFPWATNSAHDQLSGAGREPCLQN